MQNLSSFIPKISQLPCQCIGGKQALIVCVNSKCKQPAFICSLQGNCQCFARKHVDCDYKRVDFILKDLQKKINITPSVCKSIDEILLVYDEVIDQLSLDRALIEEKKRYYGLHHFSTNFVKLLQDQKYLDIQGDLMKNVKEQIETNYPPFRINTASELRKLWQKKKENFVTFRQQLFSLVDTYQQPINSTICNFKDQLVKYIGPGVKEYKLLFRASKYQFKASEFHKRCDNIKNTLVLVKTTEQEIYGGYTPLCWISPISNNFIQDRNRSTMVFSVTGGIKRDLKYVGNGITCCADAGPVFGNVALFIANRCNLNTVSYVNFPQEENSSSYSKNDFNLELKNFEVKEYQVFEVIRS